MIDELKDIIEWCEYMQKHYDGTIVGKPPWYDKLPQEIKDEKEIENWEYVKNKAQKLLDELEEYEKCDNCAYYIKIPMLCDKWCQLHKERPIKCDKHMTWEELLRKVMIR